LVIEDFTAYHREYYYKRRSKVIDFLGGECVTCGSTEDLQIDHKDPNKKSFNISNNYTLSNQSIRKELEKCQLLCRTCHEKKTAEEHTGFKHGTYYGWAKKGCSCAACEENRSEYYAARKKKRRKTGSNARGPYSHNPEHGTRAKYRRGCRCSECRASNAMYARELKNKGK
jgi:hypothetical protein